MVSYEDVEGNVTKQVQGPKEAKANIYIGTRYNVPILILFFCSFIPFFAVCLYVMRSHSCDVASGASRIDKSTRNSF